MYSLDSAGNYRVPEWDRLDWLVHGFGTRQSAALDGDPNLATLQQVHSANCVLARGRSGLLGEGDCLLENAPGKLVAVKTADCLPVLLADERNRAVAAVHAGWRGTAQRIVQHAVSAMRDHFGSRAGDIAAALGPGIGACCYEVGPEVAARFGIDAPARIHLDLTALNRGQLIEAGVSPGRIYSAGLCTMCHPAEFFSFRRDREHAGRMYSFVGVRET